jgi:hypothetical protein
MAITNIFSKRNQSSKNSIFTYNVLPKQFRIQVIHIWKESIGVYDKNDGYYTPISPSNNIWYYIHNSLCKEYGVFGLSSRGENPFHKCICFMEEENSIEKLLDIIELSFRTIDTKVRDSKYNWKEMGITQTPDNAIEELNQRFREHSIGYQYIGGQIVRVDSEYIYKESVEPAVNLLFNEGFEGASEEFMKAHEHFRKGNDKETVTEAEKAFESVMKTICNKMEWELPNKQNANLLIKTLIENNLIPFWLENSMLGLPTLRNKLTAHGQGEKSVKIPRHSVAYALHLCATNIVFLIEAYKGKSK